MAPGWGRWDPINPANIITAVLLGWAFSVYHRPYLPTLLPSYVRFDDLMPWAAWGWAALLIALALLIAPRGSVWRLTAHGLAALYLAAVASAFAAGVGITSAVTTYSVLSWVSVVLMARSAVAWQSGRGWWRRLVDDPPRWLRWLAGVGEYSRDRERRG